MSPNRARSAPGARRLCWPAGMLARRRAVLLSCWPQHSPQARRPTGRASIPPAGTSPSARARSWAPRRRPRGPRRRPGGEVGTTPVHEAGHQIVLHRRRSGTVGGCDRWVRTHRTSQNPPDFAQGQFAGVHGPSWSQRLAHRRFSAQALQGQPLGRPNVWARPRPPRARWGSSAPSHRARYCGRDVASREKNT